MAAPTQELPPWLSYTTITLPETTMTSVVYLPLTYYGPSIPLDSDWVYGGLTSPASSSVPSSSVATSTSAIPSTSSATPSTSAQPSSSSSIPSASSTTPTSSLPSSSPSASSSPSTTASTSSLSRAQLIGIIIGSVLGALVLFLLVLCCFSRYGRRRRSEACLFPVSHLPKLIKYSQVPPSEKAPSSRTPFTALFRRRPRARTRFTMLTPPVPGSHSHEDLDAEWTLVGSPTDAAPRSPPAEPGRGIDEADPFLHRDLPNPHSVSSRESNNNSNSASSRTTGSTSASGSGASGGGSSGTNASGYGVLLAHPSLSLGSQHAEGSGYNNLPPGAAAPSWQNNDAPISRRILSPSQLAVLVEEEGPVLPRRSEDSRHTDGHTDGEESELAVARRVPMSPTAEREPETRRRSWIPRFSWLLPSPRNSRDLEAGEEGEKEVLFDAGRHSRSNSVEEKEGEASSSLPPRLVSPDQQSQSPSTGTGTGMREFGVTRPLFPFLSSAPRPASGVATTSRPISGASGSIGMSSNSNSNGTNGSKESGGTVWEDAREYQTVSTRASSRGDVRANQPAAADPLDMPAPSAFARFAGRVGSRGSLRQEEDAAASEHERDGSTSTEATPSQSGSHTLAGSARTSNTTLGGGVKQPERAYSHLPPGLGVGQGHVYGEELPPVPALPIGFKNATFSASAPTPDNAVANSQQNSLTAPSNTTAKHPQGSIASWDRAGLELGFSRPASWMGVGTVGSGNRRVEDVGGGQVAPGIRVVPSAAVPPPAATSPLKGAVSQGGGGGGGGDRPGAWSPAPQLSLDLDDAPPGAEGRWRLLGGNGSGSGHSLFGSGSSGGVEAPGRRGTFGLGPAAQFHFSPDNLHASEHGSLHSRSITNNSSTSSSSNPTRSHSMYPSSGSGNSNSNSARSHVLAHAGSVEGAAGSGPRLSAFVDGVNGRRQENSSGSGSGNSHSRARSALSNGVVSEEETARERMTRSPNMLAAVPWAGGLDGDWRPVV
ncbi:hypothetical protein R3P38DRAFT_3561402 [Favolaschia claudopus]|uniref:Proteophosphoglycan ppg4 n=1 Tax=Favolaschia claudopus TaxID=2862362 RepID=A0AAW0AV63_9AGAR